MDSVNNFELGADWRKNFRELQPVKLWGANINVEREPESFKTSLLETAKQSSKNQFGYFVYQDDGKVQYHLSKYPRRKYGAIPSDEEMRKQLDDVLSNSNQKGQEEGNIIQPRIRIVLGLEEGYGTGKFHSIEDVTSFLGNTFDLTRAEIFTVKVQDGKYDTYQEPAIRIEGSLSEIKKVYGLAERLKQERFAVDDFNKQASYIVETRFCTSHDLE